MRKVFLLPPSPSLSLPCPAVDLKVTTSYGTHTTEKEEEEEEEGAWIGEERGSGGGGGGGIEGKTEALSPLSSSSPSVHKSERNHR